MAQLHVFAERIIDAPPEQVYGYLADMRDHHPNFLPPAFSDFQVESGGVGAGTVTRFKLDAGGRSRAYRMQVAEPRARPGPHGIGHGLEPGHDVHGRSRRL